MKKEIQPKEEKGITLIALVITIIVLLILAGVTIATLTGENGILTQAGNAKEITDEKGALEAVQLEVAGSFDNEGNYQSSLAKTNLENNLKATVTDKGNGKLKVEYKGYTFKVDVDGEVSISNGVDVGAIFDSTGEVENKLHIGDFINYTAGNWTDEDMNKIAETGIMPNNSTTKPEVHCQFGGFMIGGSRDGNVTPYNDIYNYVKEKETGEAVTGWRVFDVEDGKITLISAGCPEDYYQNGDNYISEYILTGNVNSNANASTLGLGTTYQARDWSMYLNSEYKEKGEATVLMREKLDLWYRKYMNVNSSSEFKCVYGTKYESMVDNYSFYWLFSTRNMTSSVYPSLPGIVTSGILYAKGVRVLITLPSDVQVSEKSVGTKTITSRDNDYNYNIWNLE